MTAGSHGDGWLVATAAVCSVALYAYLLERVRLAHVVRTFRGAQEPWWFGYARDAVSLVGAASLVFTYRVAGFADHLAVLLGALVALLEWGIHEIVAEKLEFRMTLPCTVGGSLAVVSPTLIFSNAVGGRLEQLMSMLF